MPSRIAPPPIRHGRGLPDSTSITAADSAPIPEAVMRKPKPDASLWRTCWASGGVSTLKFMPNVATSPTTVTDIRTMGVLRT